MPERVEFFTLTAEHVALLGRMYVGWQHCEYGAPEIDPKRPYGNSSVAIDIAEILDWPNGDDGITAEQEERAAALHRETQTALQVVLAARSFTLGQYALRNRYDARSWTLVEAANG